ncbi:MAG: extracellular solute-binding protein [Caldilineaceae bacterium]|nr:extracellular solute-binding protein [Caldilineaceae bacterium]
MENKLESGGRLSRRQFIRLAGVSAAGAWLVACTASAPTQPGAAVDTGSSAAAAPGGTAEINLEYMMGDAELTPPEIEQFQEANPGITITRVEPDATKYFASLAAGTPPDLFRLQAPQFPLLLARNVPLNLQSYIDVSEAIKVDDLASANNYYRSSGGALDIGSGDVYGMVKDWSPDLTIWVNLDHFAEVGLPEPSLTEPLDYTDVQAYGEELSLFEGDRSVRRGFDTNMPWVERIWMVWLEGLGQSLFTEDFTKLDLVENEAAREAVKWHYDMAASKVSSSPINPSPSWPGQDFANGELSIVQYGFWFSGGLMIWANDEMKQKIEEGRLIMLPSPTWKGEKRGPTITATGSIVTGATEHPDEAYKVFEWYNALEPAKNRAASGWGVPALKSMYADIPKDGTYRSQVWSVLEAEMEFADTTVTFNPYLQGGEPGVVASLFLQFYEQALKGEITFDELLQKLEAESNIAIQDGIDQIGS